MGKRASLASRATAIRGEVPAQAGLALLAFCIALLQYLEHRLANALGRRNVVHLTQTFEAEQALGEERERDNYSLLYSIY